MSGRSALPPVTASQPPQPAYASVLTVSKAKELLKGPLRFADSGQIAAKDLLTLLAVAKEAGLEIDECGCAELECLECAGSGVNKTGGCCQHCWAESVKMVYVDDLDKDYMLAVLEVLEA